MSSLVEFMECENIKIKSKKIRIYPNQTQREILRKWFGTSRYTYNRTVELLREPDTIAAWKSIKTGIIHSLPEWAEETPYQIRSVAIRDCCKAVSACKLKNKGLDSKDWHKVKFRSRRKTTQSIYIPKNAIRKTGIYPKYLGKMKLSEVIPDNIMDSRLTLENGKYFLLIPVEESTISCENQTRVVALDPGVRTFQTFYNPEFSGMIGEGDMGKITRLCTHLDVLISKRDKSISRKRLNKFNKAIQRMRHRIRNLVDEIHHKTARFLVDNFDVILLPSFDVSQMVKRAKRKINSKTVRSMLTWSHYRFKCFLKNKCEEFNKVLLIVNEAYTSKTVSWNGKINYSLGGSKVVKDKDHCIPRDINGARNIWVKSVSRILETLGDSPSSSNTCAMLT